ncbi:hypothetical protein ACIA48_18080 [Mycobacterium sp. NPDC051804]|uniref:hypothetical protein n=1 Tax=Mycobacterium sp. NPDC051804 TaxID=3364295 RepID=UPI00378AE4FE
MMDLLLKICVVAIPLSIPAIAAYWFFTTRARADHYGTLMIPGETTVILPAGKLKISYQEERVAGHVSTGNHIAFHVPAALQVRVINTSTGQEMPIRNRAALDTGSGWSRALIGTIQVIAPGRYTVTAGPDIGGVDSKILLGK